MKRLPLRYAPEYQARLRRYAVALKERYGKAVASVFIDAVTRAENRLKDNCSIGKSEPYLLNGQMVTLNELYFKSGPETYCIIFEITETYVGLISLWHGRGSRHSKTFTRLWH